MNVVVMFEIVATQQEKIEPSVGLYNFDEVS